MTVTIDPKQKYKKQKYKCTKIQARGGTGQRGHVESVTLADDRAAGPKLSLPSDFTPYTFI